MKKALKRTLRISGIVLGTIILLALAAALLVLFDKPLVRRIVRSQLGGSPGTTARLGRLDYSLFPFRVTVDALEFVREDAYQKMGIALTRLEARGEFWKLVRGIKPALEFIEADGVSFELELKAVSEVPFDYEALLRQASDALAWAKRISLANARVSISLLSKQLGLENFDITLTPGNVKDVVSYAMKRADLVFKKKDAAIGLATGLISSGRLGLVSPFIVDGDFALSRPRLTAGSIEESFDAVTIALAGRLDTYTHELSVSRLAVGVPGLFDLEGKASGRLGQSVLLESEAKVRLDDLEAAAARFGPRLPAALRSLKLEGRADLSGTYVLQRSSEETRDNVSASLSLEDVDLEKAVGALPLRIRVAGRIDAAGPSRDPHLTADLRMSAGRLAAAGLAVERSDVHVVGSAAKSGADISRLEAKLSGLSYDAGQGRGLAFGTATMTGKGRFDLDKKIGTLEMLNVRLGGLSLAAGDGKGLSFETAAMTAEGSLDIARKSAALTRFDARLSGLPPLTLSGRLGFGESGDAEATIGSRGLDIPTLRKMAGPLLPAALGGWDIGGTADLDLSVRRTPAKGPGWMLSGKLALAGASFSNPSFPIEGGGLDPIIKFEGIWTPSNGVSVTGGLDIGRGESLLKTIYISWNQNPLKLTFGGRYDPVSGGIDGLVAHAVLMTIGDIDVSGSAKIRTAPSFDLRTDARLSLGPLYSLFSQSGVSDETRMKLEGGLGAALRVRKDGDALSVRGRVTLANTGVERTATKTFLLGVAADLPVQYESAGTAPPVPDASLPEKGYFYIRTLQSPLLTLKDLGISLRSGVNAFAIEPLGLELFGGRLEIGPTTFRLDPRSGSFQGLGSLALRDIDISRFPVSSPQFKLTGKVQAEFPRLDISSEAIGVSGRGEAEMFGGKIVLRDLAVVKPFSSARAISLNVDLIDLDLKKLTDEVPFGEVTGIIRGDIRNLLIRQGEPEQFDFRIESVPHRGVRQTFSLKAVNNLTVISQGETASMGKNQFWMRFIRGFRYERLGIVSTLRYDKFTINGTTHEHGIEYLVKKGPVFGISVVNRMPDRVISFKEMTSRLKRVGQSEK